MTSQEYLERLKALVATGQDQAILDLAQQFGPEVHPQLSDADLARVSGVLHGAVMALDLAATDEAREQTGRTA